MWNLINRCSFHSVAGGQQSAILMAEKKMCDSYDLAYPFLPHVNVSSYHSGVPVLFRCHMDFLTNQSSFYKLGRAYHFRSYKDTPLLLMPFWFDLLYRDYSKWLFYMPHRFFDSWAGRRWKQWTRDIQTRKWVNYYYFTWERVKIYNYKTIPAHLWVISCKDHLQYAI